MKLSHPLSFLLCLPAMAKADEGSPDDALLRALQDQPANPETEHRQLSGGKSGKGKSGKGDSGGWRRALEDQVWHEDMEAER
eukprot:scaffold26494_cov117-Skeletonema_dohrnii-CCMP3373.AAC.1